MSFSFGNPSALTLQQQQQNTSHPLIPSSQEYAVEKKYVSIHSEDRNIQKYPCASEFEIELPQDYLNVSTVALSTWSFPSNDNVFSLHNQNDIMTFSFTNVYFPGSGAPLIDILTWQFLEEYTNSWGGTEFIITIHNGFYNPVQMANELTLCFNETVTLYLSQQFQTYDTAHGTTLNATFLNVVNGVVTGGYNDFVVAYNQVEQKLWFGNRSSSFSLTQNVVLLKQFYALSGCSTKNVLPDASIGLPSYIGLYCNSQLESITVSASDVLKNPSTIPRFYYGDALQPGDGGYWLTPNPAYTDASISYVEAPQKINLLGQPYFYLDIFELNSIDETSPFNPSAFQQTTNQTNSRVLASFAKIPLCSTPNSVFYDQYSPNYKYFSPPCERIRRLKIRVRYHNDELVDFGNASFSFLLEFTLFSPQILRKLNASSAYIPSGFPSA